MNTLILFALTGALTAGSRLEPSWQVDYFQAQKDAAAAKRPMVVLFGAGPDIWSSVIRAGKPTQEVKRLMADHFVCVFVDTKTVTGRRLARDFDLSGSVGLVISDRGGSSQAFWHQGDMTKESLAVYIRKYADRSVAVLRTETATTTQRTSFYPPSVVSSPSPARASAPANC